jgi:hypothetical protein
MADPEQCFGDQPTNSGKTDCRASVLGCFHLKGITEAPHKTAADCRHRVINQGRVIDMLEE